LADFARRYSKLSDHRLAQLAADPSALIPEAREALEAEMARRPPPAARRSAQDETSISTKDPLDGVTGWLFWYCLGLFGSAYNEIRMSLSQHGAIGVAFSILCIGIAAWNVATGNSLLRRASFTLRMILIQLAAGCLQGTIIAADGIALLVYSPRTSGLAAALIGAGLAICAGYATWFRYFQVSKRVKITLGRNL